ncbi:hypothetical protein XALC_1222 [Xanthomonas albilineans GPE PC73]|uniref:Uncharacterized protein n=1 Tax=Xanthomonas albilineans (strain GPE PC73 / CFBP 7063) TaxID=380358 RepID=D2UA03_XANAP|nr:hypothetical protein XALC_1222 [Xanthomonas albilineans GPE PC73]
MCFVVRAPGASCSAFAKGMQSGRYPLARKIDGLIQMPLEALAEILDPAPATQPVTPPSPHHHPFILAATIRHWVAFELRACGRLLGASDGGHWRAGIGR